MPNLLSNQLKQIPMFHNLEDLKATLRGYCPPPKKQKKTEYKYDGPYNSINEIPAFNGFIRTNHPNLMTSYEDFNKIYCSIKYNQDELGYFADLRYTPNGNLVRDEFNYIRSWHCEPVFHSNCDLQFINLDVVIDREIFKCSFGFKGTADSKIGGKTAFKHFVEISKEEGIDLTKYAVDEATGLNFKTQMENQVDIRRNPKFPRKMYSHMNHLDFNSAWPSGICAKYPEFIPVFKKMRDKYKHSTLSKAIGFCQSKYVNYAYAGLSKEGICWCHDQIMAYIKKLDAAGFDWYCLNTDGIWYRSKDGTQRVYTDENEGTDLFQYKNDYVDCRAYFSNDGQYFFYDASGKFNIRARGFYQYESIKPRDQWDVRDYFAATQTNIVLYWDDDFGLISNVFKSEELTIVEQHEIYKILEENNGN